MQGEQRTICKSHAVPYQHAKLTPPPPLSPSHPEWYGGNLVSLHLAFGPVLNLHVRRPPLPRHNQHDHVRGIRRCGQGRLFEGDQGMRPSFQQGELAREGAEKAHTNNKHNVSPTSTLGFPSRGLSLWVKPSSSGRGRSKFCAILTKFDNIVSHQLPTPTRKEDLECQLTLSSNPLNPLFPLPCLFILGFRR